MTPNKALGIPIKSLEDGFQHLAGNRVAEVHGSHQLAQRRSDYVSTIDYAKIGKLCVAALEWLLGQRLPSRRNETVQRYRR